MIKAKIFSIFFLLNLGCNVVAQYGIRISPIVSLERYDVIHKNKGEISELSILSDYRNLIRNGNLGYRAGLNFNFPAFKNVTIIFGIHLFKLGINYDYDSDLFDELSNNAGVGTWPTNNNVPIIEHHKYISNYLGFPFTLRLNKNCNKYFYYIEGGASLNYRYKYTRFEKLEDTEQTKEVFSQQDLQVFANLGIGIGYQISDGTNLSISPLMRYKLRGIDTNGGSYNIENPFTVGLMLKVETYLLQ